MQNPIEIAKAHPYLTAGGVAVLGIVLVLILSGGTETEVVQSEYGGFNPYASENAAANSALAQAQLGAQVATTQLNNELSATKDSNATAAKVAQANFDYLSNKDVLASKVAIRGIEAEEEGIRTAGQVSMLQINKAAEVANNQTAGAITLGLAGFDRDRFIASQAAGVENSRITAAANTQKLLADNALTLRTTELIYGERAAQAQREFDARENAADRSVTISKNTNDYTLAAFQQASSNVLALSRR